MKMILHSLIIFFFVCYWFITFIFTLPDNYIKISLSKYEETFQLFLSQRWEFFAPPPQYDERLYFTYINDKLKSEKVLEVLKPILEKKKRDAPFNKDADILDYLLSNSMNSINDLMSQEYKVYKYNKNTTIEETDVDTTFERKLVPFVQRYHSFKTLHNYAVIVAKKNNIDSNFSKLVLRITKVSIPKFNQRFSDSQRLEETLFKSDTLPLFK